MIEAKVKGLKELENNINKLMKSYSKPQQAINHLRPAVRKSLKSSLEELKAKTPVDTGELRSTAKIDVRTPNRNDRKLNKKAILIGNVGYRWKKGEVHADLYKRVLAIEYGTKYQPARRIISSIANKNYRSMVDTYGQEIKKAIVKTSKEIGIQ